MNALDRQRKAWIMAQQMDQHTEDEAADTSSCDRAEAHVDTRHEGEVCGWKTLLEQGRLCKCGIETCYCDNLELCWCGDEPDPAAHLDSDEETALTERSR